MEEKKEIYDLIIIGAGPAGVTAGVYAARKKIRTLLITKEFGGQSVVSESIENWTGEISIKGKDLAEKMKNHVKYYESEDFVIKEFSLVEKIEKNENNNFSVKTNDGKIFESRAIIIASGSKRRKLEIPGADKFEHKGLTYCASCDGPLFTDKDVVVVGGGNSGFEAASQLLAYCKSVAILHRRNEFKAEELMKEQVLSNKKTVSILNAEITEVFGDEFVTGIKYIDKNSGEEKTLNVSGVFVEIGAIPATNFIDKNLVDKNQSNEITVDHRNCRTSQEGIWAAGDVNDGLYQQNGIALGDGVKAVEDAYQYLQKKQ